MATAAARGAMGQVERDRYNIKRGGTAGLPYLIKLGETPDQAKARFASGGAGTAAQAGQSTAPTGSTGALPPGLFQPGVAPATLPTSTEIPGLPDWLQTEIKKRDAATGERTRTDEARFADILGGYGGLSQTATDFYQKQAQDTALANQQINEGWANRYTQLMGDLENAGLQERSDIREAYGGQQANAAQRLTDLGLGGTTIAPTTAAGIQRAESGEEGRLNERLRRERLATRGGALADSIRAYEAQNATRGGQLSDYTRQALGIGADTLRFKESRTDTRPGNKEALWRLAAEYGAGGGAGGGGMMTVGPSLGMSGGVGKGGFNHFDYTTYDPRPQPSASWQGGSAGSAGSAETMNPWPQYDNQGRPISPGTKSGSISTGGVPGPSGFTYGSMSVVPQSSDPDHYLPTDASGDAYMPAWDPAYIGAQSNAYRGPAATSRGAPGQADKRTRMIRPGGPSATMRRLARLRL